MTLYNEWSESEEYFYAWSWFQWELISYLSKIWIIGYPG